MNRLALGSFVLAWAAIVVVPADAQPPRGAQLGRGGMTLTGLLAQESVQKELKLSDEQKAKVKDIADKQRESFRGLRDLSTEELMAEIQKQIKENEEALSGALGADPMTRLRQISLQVRGAAAFSDPTVVSALSLTDEQQAKVKAIQDEAQQARRAFDPDQLEESRARIEAARKAAREKTQELLTEEQKTKWKELIGAPFTGEIRRPEFPGRGRRGGDRPRGDTPPADQA